MTRRRNVIHVRYVVVNYIITIFGNHIICRNTLFLQTGTTKYLFSLLYRIYILYIFFFVNK